MYHSNAIDNATYFRRQGYSLNEIANITKIPKSTLSKWLRDVHPDAEGNIRMEKRLKFFRNRASKNNFQIRKNKEYKIRNNAKKTVDSLGNSSLAEKKLQCALIYYCRGSRSITGGINFIDSDQTLIRTFVRLLRKSFKIEENRLKLCMYLHSYHSEAKQKKFWSKITSISVDRFTKSIIKKDVEVNKKTKYQGSLRVKYGSVDIARELLETARFYFQSVK